MERYNEIIELLSKEDISTNERVSLLIELSDLYDSDGNITDAFKYASLSTIASDSPRADACCCMGGRYMEIGNTKWAIKWFENAISNISDCDPKYYTWLPTLGIAQVHFLNLNLDDATRYVNAADIMSPGNEDILNFKKAIEEMQKDFSKK